KSNRPPTREKWAPATRSRGKDNGASRGPAWRASVDVREFTAKLRQHGWGAGTSYMLKTFARAILLLLFLLVPLQWASAQGTRCADCHLANPDAPGHLYAWERSAHGQHNVGCEACHGGDATTFESFAAHRGILNSG